MSDAPSSTWRRLAHGLAPWLGLFALGLYTHRAHADPALELAEANANAGLYAASVGVTCTGDADVTEQADAIVDHLLTRYDRDHLCLTADLLAGTGRGGAGATLPDRRRQSLARDRARAERTGDRVALTGLQHTTALLFPPHRLRARWGAGTDHPVGVMVRFREPPTLEERQDAVALARWILTAGAPQWTATPGLDLPALDLVLDYEREPARVVLPTVRLEAGVRLALPGGAHLTPLR